MTMDQAYDAVIMLTWSNWKTEPRSNRYHYATRFAREVPVLFVQPWADIGTPIEVEPTAIPNIELVHGPIFFSEQDSQWFKNFLYERGIRKPLLWIYDSMHYDALINALPGAYRVYHATEDYITPSSGCSAEWEGNMSVVGHSVLALLPRVDCMVAVSQGVLDVYRTKGHYNGQAILAENGCDAEYFIEKALSCEPLNSRAKDRPIALFQGGINARLDYDLLHKLIENMPDWTFRFCGAATDTEGWLKVRALPNVVYKGKMEPEEFSREMYEATVGIIPYIQDEWIRNSLPLKAYEYTACGLPVVTVPIAALETKPTLFCIGTNASEFEQHLRACAASRYDASMIKARQEESLANSYNKRFDMVKASLIAAIREQDHSNRRLQVLILYDCIGSMHVSTIKEHLEAFDRYSGHRIHYMPATPQFWNATDSEITLHLNLAPFDVVMVHYSTRLSVHDHLHRGIAEMVRAFNGVKILFIQDEYESTEMARTWMDLMRFDVVYTCIPPESVEAIYPYSRFPGTEFIQTLTGYVPESLPRTPFSQSMQDRTLRIGYRGRELPPIYGMLGHEKYIIGTQVKLLAQAANIAVDIELSNEKRIYGDDWYKFLGSVRATLGTESGSNIFDIDGTLRQEIAAYQSANPQASFDDIYAALLAPHEESMRMNQVSPKIFEAIKLGTALVLFEGNYSGIIQPDVHYIPLKKDFSNIDEVFAKLEDLDYLERLTKRAYVDIVESGNYSYETFVRNVDQLMITRVRHARNSVLYSASLLYSDGTQMHVALPCLPIGLHHGQHALGGPFTRMASAIQYDTGPVPVINNSANTSPKWLRKLWRILPFRLRRKILTCLRYTGAFGISIARRTPFLKQQLLKIWQYLPHRARKKLYYAIKS